MTQTVQAKCPHCRNVLRIPSEWLNKSMRCKHCKQTFQAKAKTSVPIALPAPKASTPMAQPASVPVAIGVAAGPPPSSTGGHPFGFDDGDTPAPAGSTPKRRGSGRGMLVLALMFFFLFVLGASGAAFVVYKVANTPTKVAKGDSSRTDGTSSKSNGGTENPASDGPADKDKTKVNNDRAKDPPPSDDAKKDKDKKIIPPMKDKDKKKDALPPRDLAKKDGKKPPPFTNDPFPRRALLISVNNYLMFNPIHYGSPRDMFKNGYPGSSTGVLRDRLNSPPMNFHRDQLIELSDAIPRDAVKGKAHPTQKSVIEAAIKDFVDSSREQDRIILFFAGHATHLEDKKSYLIPISGNVTDADSLIPLQWVYDQLARCKAQQKILILDVFRYSPARGNSSATGGEGEEGTMPEGFDKDLLSPPAGVQVWSACQMEKEDKWGGVSVELEGGSAFLQALCNSLQGGAEMKGISGVAEPLPIDDLVVSVNKRLDDLLKPEKRKQVSRLTGKPSAANVAYNKTEPMPDPMKLKQPTVPGGNVAGMAQINKMLDEIKLFGSVRESRAGEKDLLTSQMLPPFSVKKLEPYATDGYQNIGELYKKYVDMKKQFKDGKPEEKEAFDKQYPLRRAYFEIVEALNESSKINPREVLRSPFDPKQKAIIFKEQEPLGIATFHLEQTLALVQAAAKEREKETSMRWRANFDFAHARLLARLVYLIEYNYTLARIRSDDLPELAPGQTGWRVGTARKINSETKTKNYGKEVKVIFGRIQNENPDTPWALLALREREMALGVQWRAKSD